MLGIGASAWAYWLTYTDVRDRAASEAEIVAACGGIVDAELVMDLRGGMVRATAYRPDGNGLRLEALPGLCRIYGVPEPGRSDSLVTVVVRSSDDGKPMNLVGDEVGREPFDRGADPDLSPDDVTRFADHAEPWPLGDGRLGHYGDASVTVRAVCAAGKPAALEVTVKAEYDDVSDEDRGILAEVARGSAEKATAEVGCKARLPQLPARLPKAERELGAAKSASASCDWYGRHLDASGRGRLPDRMLETPVAARSTTETCLLAVSPDGVRAIAPQLSGSSREYARHALTHSPWWMRTASYFDAGPTSVAYDHADHDTYLAPGTADAGEGESGVWWASSVCDGRPAAHTLTVSYTYDDVVLDRLAALFRAYVDDVTERRGCTDVKFPASSAFEADD